MKLEEQAAIKCDRCGESFGLYMHGTGWRCPVCIWKDRKELIKWFNYVLAILPDNIRDLKEIVDANKAVLKVIE